MKFSYNWLREFVPKLPPPERLAELVARHAFEVEGIGKRGDDTLLDVAILSNRMPDAGGHAGFAREVAAITKLKANATAYRALEPKGSFLDVKISDKDAVLRYHGALITGVSVKPSPKWLRDRLESLGIRSINAVVDVTNYVMLELGFPLHAFDYDKIHGKKFTIRLSRSGENMKTLDGATHALPEGAIVIEDDERIVDLAGIMGGENSAISEKTTSVFLQAAVFAPSRIHRASGALGIRTEAARRYAAGIDPNAASDALSRAAALMAELAGGKVAGVLDKNASRLAPVKIRFRPVRVHSLLGLAVPEKEMRSTFERLGFGASSRASDWTMTIPTFRRDIALEEDLIEEIGRMHGYDAIPEIQPVGALVHAATDVKITYRDRVLSAFRAVGFDEVQTYSFIGERDAEQFDAETRASLIALENPQSQRASLLRPMLLPSLLREVAEAMKVSKTVRFVESGRVFREKAGFRDAPELEERRLSFAFAERADKADKRMRDMFFELKGSLSAAFESLGMADVWFDDALKSGESTKGVLGFLNPHQAAEIKIGDRAIGVFGVAHPDTRRALGISVPVVAGELYLDAFEKELESEKEYEPISKYPAVLRDIAVLVPRDVRMADVEDVIQNTGGELLADVDLFDDYEGDEVGGSERNLAFHLIFQSRERSLTDKEVEVKMGAIKKALESHPDWEVR